MNESERPPLGAHVLKNIEARELGQARAILMVLGLLTVITQWLVYSDLAKQADIVGLLSTADLAAFHKLRMAVIAGIAVGVIFIACGIMVKRTPLLATVTGLGLYVATIVAQAVIDPSTLWMGLFGTGVRVVVLIGLVSAVQFARIFERSRRARQDFPRASVVGS